MSDKWEAKIVEQKVKNEKRWATSEKKKIDKQQVKSEKLVAHKLNTKTMNGKNRIQLSDQFSDENNSAMSEKNHENCIERMFVY